MQAPTDFIAVSAICALAAALGNGVRIAPKQNDDWVVVPNLWGMIIGRPSAMKSPAMKEALGPLQNLEKDLRDQWSSDCGDAELEAKLAKLTEHDRQKKAKGARRRGFGCRSRCLVERRARPGGPRGPPRLVVNDVTVEKLGELLNENPRGLLLVRDELHGALSRLDREDYQSERAFYLEAYNGDGSFTFDRIGRGTIHIPCCTLSMIGGIQPSRVSSLVAEAAKGGGSDGLLQRFQLVGLAG